MRDFTGGKKKERRSKKHFDLCAYVLGWAKINNCKST